MKRITLILLFGCLISNIYTRDSCYDLGDDAEGNEIHPEKKEDCTDYKLTDFEKIYGDSCCYVVSKYKNSEEEYKGCSVYNKKYITKEYIDEYIKEENEDREENYKLESYSIECRGNWISFSFIFAFFVFLF